MRNNTKRVGAPSKKAAKAKRFSDFCCSILCGMNNPNNI